MANEIFEKEKLCFVQNSESVRSLNQIMWQIPLVAMTLTGGLWYGAASTAQLPVVARSGLLLFVTVVNFLLIFVIWRVRAVMGEYIAKAKSFYPEGAPDTHVKSNYSCLKEKIVVKVFSLILMTTAIMSLIGVFVLPETPLNDAHKLSTTECVSQ
jgi:hypothetical protein